MPLARSRNDSSASDSQAEVRLAEVDGGTRVVVSTDMRPKGFAAALSPVLRLFMRRELASKYATFAQACDGQSDATPA
jgi:hypothetical protein